MSETFHASDMILVALEQQKVARTQGKNPTGRDGCDAVNQRFMHHHLHQFAAPKLEIDTAQILRCDVVVDGPTALHRTRDWISESPNNFFRGGSDLYPRRPPPPPTPFILRSTSVSFFCPIAVAAMREIKRRTNKKRAIIASDQSARACPCKSKI